MPIIKYQKGEPPLVLSDAINLSDEEFNKMSEQDIEDIKEYRFQQWYAIVTAPPESYGTQEQIVEEGPIDG